MPEQPWRMHGEYGIDADSLEPGDWLVNHRYRIDEPNRWCQVVDAKPTPPDLDPCAMDVIVLWEGESKRTHYRIPRSQHHFAWAGKHRAVCGHCGGPFPCEQVRMQREMARAVAEDSRRCVVCGKTEGGTMTIQTETPDGFVMSVYHTAKSRKRCRAAYIAAASERDLAWLRQSDAAWSRK